jgi:hypothetical protein
MPRNLFDRLGKLAQNNGCILLFKAQKESLSGNRKLNLATFRPTGSHTVELLYTLKESESEKPDL